MLFRYSQCRSFDDLVFVLWWIQVNYYHGDRVQFRVLKYTVLCHIFLGHVLVHNSNMKYLCELVANLVVLLAIFLTSLFICLCLCVTGASKLLGYLPWQAWYLCRHGHISSGPAACIPVWRCFIWGRWHSASCLPTVWKKLQNSLYT